MRITFLLCIVYWIFLTVLLLVPDPAAVVGMCAVPHFPWGKFGIHLMAFTFLSLLVNSTRWPKRPGVFLISMMAIYGMTTEALQIFVPHRTSQVIDGVENLLGIALGTAVYWLSVRLARKRSDRLLNKEDAMRLERLSRIGHKKYRMRTSNEVS